ncbi:hypothetical protein ACF0H5_017733 [Mactra antiquata]
MSDTTGGRDREEVSMLYGGTQIAVLAKNVTTGEEVNADIVFESSEIYIIAYNSNHTR